MLNPEYAQEQLRALKVEDWKARRIANFGGLSEDLRSIGYGILGYDLTGELVDRKILPEIQEQAFKQLDALNSSERIQILSVLFPQFPTQVEQAWQLFDRLPYQSSYHRKAFRTPNHRENNFFNRYQWLNCLLQAIEGYEQSLTWFAAWTPYLSYYAGDTLGILLAAAIDLEDELGEEIFQILLDSARGEHEIGAMGRHATRGLLVASRFDGWEFVEKLLLAAQRQEGLRQTILETIDEAHPEAFRRMVRLIVDNNLTRFSATIRAIDVWFGFGWESINTRIVNQILDRLASFLENAKAQQEALVSDDPQTVYLALWTLGFNDAIAAIPHATKLFSHPKPEHRFVAVYFLSQLGLTEAKLALLPVLEDEDLRVATYAVNAIRYVEDRVKETDLFESLERIIPRFPEKNKLLSPLVWEWMKLETSQQLVANALLHNLGKRSAKRLISYLSRLDPYGRREVAIKLAEIQPWDEEIRNTLFSLIGDASQWVREEVIKLLTTCTITRDEAVLLEKLLTRKSSDLRRAIIQLLLNQRDEDAIASALRLLDAKQVLQRQAGLELLREMVKKERSFVHCSEIAREYQQTRSKLTDPEIQLLNTILEIETEEPTLEDALGLIDPQQLTKPITPEVKQPRVFVSDAAKACLKSLDDLIHEHRQTEITYETRQGTEQELLGNISVWKFPSPKPNLSREENLNRFPLKEVWQAWYEERSPELRDEDGFELVRAIAPLYNYEYELKDIEVSWLEKLQYTLFTHHPQLKYQQLAREILNWLIYLHLDPEFTDFLLDAVVTTLNLISQEDLINNPNFVNYKWRFENSIFGWLTYLRIFRSLFSFNWKYEHQRRFWDINFWIYSSPVSKILRSNYLLSLADFAIAYYGDAINKSDLISHLFAILPTRLNKAFSDANNVNEQISKWTFRELSNLTARKPLFKVSEEHLFKKIDDFEEFTKSLSKELLEIGDRCRQRILEIELKRGDLPTAASYPALALRSVEGIEIIIKLMQALGKETLVRSYTYDNLSKSSVFSHLIRVSFPAAEDTPAEFAKQVKKTNTSQERLIDLAFYAPQWSKYVEAALEWENFAEAVWWIHAHTKDNNWQVDREIRETWTAKVSELTPLSSQNLIDGAVDVDWFDRIYKTLKAEKWNILDRAAKYASGGGGHKRAQLFAEAMLGKIERNILVDRITQKRHQDAVRALGLLPVATGKKRDKDLLDRYQIIQEFLRTSKKFGSQRQASEKLAATIALENLARTAGYRDPQRLEWAMEAQAVADLAEKPITVTIDEVSVSLAIDNGETTITVLKNEKPLKSIPAKLKKNPQISELQTRKQAIAKQATRMRLSLEEAMCRGDSFTRSELQQLCAHPVLAPMLERLIFVGEFEIGYPVEKGQALQSHDGTISKIQSDRLHIAHPYDLLKTEAWHLWQQECFSKELIQPFKQVFRELYVLTDSEQSNKKTSRRYEGHQLNSRQALALFGKRGWVTRPEEGVRRTFHHLGISAWVTFLDGFCTPSEVEGLTLEEVYFSKRGEWKPLELTEIPPQIFSEVMRDLDLVVSVAHQGGVDPEASASTVEMRSTLIKETCRLMKLDNVKLRNSHALIEGKLGSYSVHLGSAIVHRQPGGSLCIVPIHSQHRGRLFLPFADDDPKTAEVISKVLLLAKDKEIQDPTILSQIL
jgi:HEAT repeat protein/Trp operon repressor